MSDVRKTLECSYCGASCHIKFTEELIAQFCPFCGDEYMEPEDEEVEEDDDGDLDYTDDERGDDRYA
jgi:hypothetical protein